MFSKEQVYGKGGDVGPIRLARSSRMKRPLYAWGVITQKAGRDLYGGFRPEYVCLGVYFRKHKITFKILNEALNEY